MIIPPSDDIQSWELPIKCKIFSINLEIKVDKLNMYNPTIDWSLGSFYFSIDWQFKFDFRLFFVNSRPINTLEDAKLKVKYFGNFEQLNS